MVCLCFCSVPVSKSNHLAYLNMLTGRQYKVIVCVLGSVVPGEDAFVLPQNLKSSQEVPQLSRGSVSCSTGAAVRTRRAVRSEELMERVRTALILSSVCLRDSFFRVTTGGSSHHYVPVHWPLHLPPLPPWSQGLFWVIFREVLKTWTLFSPRAWLLACGFRAWPFRFHRKQNGRLAWPAVQCLLGNILPSPPFFIVHLFSCAIACLWHKLVANSMCSNYSALIHCSIPANNLSGAGGRALSAPVWGTLWWLPKVKLWHHPQLVPALLNFPSLSSFVYLFIVYSFSFKQPHPPLSLQGGKIRAPLWDETPEGQCSQSSKAQGSLPSTTHWRLLLTQEEYFFLLTFVNRDIFQEWILNFFRECGR